MLSIKIPSSAEVIGKWCFFKSSIENIEFEPNSQLQDIGYGAFCECKNIKNIIIPQNVTHVGGRCFNGSSIQNIFVENPNDIKFEEECFQNVPENFKIHFKKSCKIYGEGAPPNKYIVIWD